MKLAELVQNIIENDKREKQELEQEKSERERLELRGCEWAYDQVVKCMSNEYEIDEEDLRQVLVADSWDSFRENDKENDTDDILPSLYPSFGIVSFVLDGHFRFDLKLAFQNGGYIPVKRGFHYFLYYFLIYHHNHNGCVGGAKTIEDALLFSKNMYDNYQEFLAKEEAKEVEEMVDEPERTEIKRCPLQQDDVRCGDWCEWYSSLCESCELIQALGSIAMWAERLCNN